MMWQEILQPAGSTCRSTHEGLCLYALFENCKFWPCDCAPCEELLVVIILLSRVMWRCSYAASIRICRLSNFSFILLRRVSTAIVRRVMASNIWCPSRNIGWFGIREPSWGAVFKSVYVVTSIFKSRRTLRERRSIHTDFRIIINARRRRKLWACGYIVYIIYVRGSETDWAPSDVKWAKLSRPSWRVRMLDPFGRSERYERDIEECVTDVIA